MGIVKGGEGIIEEYKGSPALEAGLLAVAQAVEHYEISRYGTLNSCYGDSLAALLFVFPFTLAAF
jgi:ferritin-like metal-binding protein YciE